ncbi:MAG: hypothetical protein LBB53_01710 [Prevotellaceae bacterium]|jgi:hypothetical protein|nr:hypothetical protein [Prevotellaceae bacterium]
MKKSLLFIGLFAAVIAFASCSGKGAKSEEGKQCDSVETAKCQAKAEFDAKWTKFDSLAVEEQEALIAQRVECFNKCREACAAKKAECDAKKTEEAKEVTPECAAKKAECEAKKAEIEAEWAAFETKTLAEKKAFFDKLDSLKAEKKCCKEKAKGEKKCCKKEGGKKCCKGKKAE